MSSNTWAHCHRDTPAACAAHTSTAHSHTMEDIFYFIREGNVMQVRMWLDDTEHDMNQG